MTLDSKALLDGTPAVSGKATLREMYDLLNGLSDSQFAVMASGEHCEDLLGAIVGSMARALDDPSPPVKGDSVELVERIGADMRAYAEAAMAHGWKTAINALSDKSISGTWEREWFERNPPSSAMQSLEASGHTALSERVVVLEGVLRSARKIVASDADACRAFAAPGETSEPEEVLKLIDAALKGCDALGGGE